MKRRDIGILGEKMARAFLEEKGYHIIETNYRCSEGEIDIIGKYDDSLVFVEVRTKTSLEYGSPEESITSTKKQRLINIAEYYQQTHINLPAQWRIDVVAIELTQHGKLSRIELIENAVTDG